MTAGRRWVSIGGSAAAAARLRDEALTATGLLEAERGLFGRGRKGVLRFALDGVAFAFGLDGVAPEVFFVTGGRAVVLLFVLEEGVTGAGGDSLNVGGISAPGLLNLLESHDGNDYTGHKKKNDCNC